MNLKRFFIKTTISIVICLLVIFIVSRPEGTFESSKHFFNVTFRENFQFGKISEWVEKNYGTMSAFLPTDFQKSEEDSPVSGKVVSKYREVSGGFMVDTGNGSVLSLADGVVTFVDEKGQDGGVVGVELADGSSVLYCGLDAVNVRIYQHVQRGDLLGTTDPSSVYFLQAQGSQGLLD